MESKSQSGEQFCSAEHNTEPSPYEADFQAFTFI